MNNITITNLRSQLSEVYNSVKYTGNPVLVTNHGDEDVVIMRVSDVYPNPTNKELLLSAAYSGAYPLDDTDYE